MFSKIITNSEEFLELPATSQLLYFHLNMNADDDGFVQPARIMRMSNIGNKDDLKILQAKGFIIPIADRVIVIKHWHVNNTIRKDRYSPGIFQEHLKALGLEENGTYISGKPKVDQLDTHYSIVEDSIDKDSIVYIYNHWNTLYIQVHNKQTDKMKRKINTFIKDYSKEDIIQSMNNYAEIVHSKKHYFDHKWTIIEFLDRGIEKFMNREIAWNNYLSNKKGSNEIDNINELMEDAKNG